MSTFDLTGTRHRPFGNTRSTFREHPQRHIGNVATTLQECAENANRETLCAAA